MQGNPRLNRENVPATIHASFFGEVTSIQHANMLATLCTVSNCNSPKLIWCISYCIMHLQVDALDRPYYWAQCQKQTRCLICVEVSDTCMQNPKFSQMCGATQCPQQNMTEATAQHWNNVMSQCRACALRKALHVVGLARADLATFIMCVWLRTATCKDSSPTCTHKSKPWVNQPIRLPVERYCMPWKQPYFSILSCAKMLSKQGLGMTALYDKDP